jgi:hypothetical protein
MFGYGAKRIRFVSVECHEPVLHPLDSSLYVVLEIETSIFVRRIFHEYIIS